MDCCDRSGLLANQLLHVFSATLASKTIFNQPPLGIERGHASRTSRCYRLPIVIIGDISSGKNTVNAGPGPLWSRPDDISGFGELNLSIKKTGVGRMANGDK